MAFILFFNNFISLSVNINNMALRLDEIDQEERRAFFQMMEGVIPIGFMFGLGIVYTIFKKQIVSNNSLLIPFLILIGILTILIIRFFIGSFLKKN